MDNLENLLETLLETTVKLIEVDESKKPVGVASGFVLKRDEKNVLISAGHCFKNSKQIAIETSIISGRETLIFALPPVNLVKKGNLLTGKFSDLDIAWTSFDPNEVNKLDEDDERLNNLKIELHAYQGPIHEEPEKNRIYAFASWSRTEFHPAKQTLIREAASEAGMQYIGKDTNGLYKFQLSRKHRGHDYYKGSSGAPIADEEGKIVSIVLKGDEDDNIIYGFPISSLAEIIEHKEI